MKRESTFRIPLSAVMSHLYGYIFSMLVSNVLVGMPLFGGALYLCGRAVLVLTSVYGKRNRRYLPVYSRWWGALLAVVLLVIGVLLMGLYPADLPSRKVWLVFAAVALCLVADAGIGLLLRRKRAETENPEPETESGKPELLELRAYRSFEIISLLIMAAMELTVSASYALLATGTEHILPALAVGIGCTLAASWISMFLLRWTRKPKRQDPTWLLCVGLILWLGGVGICSRQLRSGIISLTWIYICLAASSVGSTLCYTGLVKIDALMPGVVELAGQSDEATYRRQRYTNMKLAQLLGDVLSLIGLSVFCFATRNELPGDLSMLAARFQPVMLVPLILVMIFALICSFSFPLSNRYINKLRLFLRLKRNGEDNPVLRKQLEHVVAERYRQPWLTRFLIAVLRPFYRHTLVNTDHIVLDDANPLVFLGNHAEIYGPIVCILYFPVPIRTWTISMMMFDRKKVTQYLYENTFSKKTFLPVFMRKGLAALLGWLSVMVMSQLENIPVYKDSPMKLRDTLRQSIEAMESGDNLLIFPESQDGKYQRGGIGKIAPGFVMLAEAYWKKTGKKLRMLPLYANREARTITFGEVILYEPERGFREEQERIVNETSAQITRMAEIVPEKQACEAERTEET